MNVNPANVKQYENKRNRTHDGRASDKRHERSDERKAEIFKRRAEFDLYAAYLKGNKTTRPDDRTGARNGKKRVSQFSSVRFSAVPSPKLTYLRHGDICAARP